MKTALLNKTSIGFAAAVAAGIVLASAAPASAQLGSSSQLQDLLDSFLSGNTTTSSSTTTGQGTTTSGISGNTRQTLITNQFTSTAAGSLQARRPGLWIQQSIAVSNGATDYFTGVPDEEPNFFRDTFDQMFEETANVISQILTGINTFLTSLFNGGSSGGGSNFVPIDNAATSGHGTTHTIN